MAIYIPIRKMFEDDKSAIYRYRVEAPKMPLTDRDRPRPRVTEAEYSHGQLRIDKQSGAIEVIELAAGDADQRHYSRAARKLSLHWEEGVLPEKTSWSA
jgi:hypothetical protein